MTTNPYEGIFPEDNLELNNTNEIFKPAFTLREYNFHLPEDVKTLIMQKVENTLELAPSNSCTIVTLIQQGTNYKGSINISSYFISFESTGEGHDPLDLIKSLCRNIRNQLHNWKKSRFTEVNIDPDGYLQAI